MNHQYRIQDKNVALRPLLEKDIESLRVWRNDSKNSKYIKKIPHINKEGQLAWFRRELEDGTSITFAIDYNGEMVGSVSLYDIKDKTCKFGRLMIGAHKGKGIGGVATKLACEFAFNHLSCDKVFAEVSVDNTSALKIYVRCGFEVASRRFNPSAEMDEFEILLTRERFGALKGMS